MPTTQPIRNKKQVHEITEYYLNRGELRNYLLDGVDTRLY